MIKKYALILLVIPFLSGCHRVPKTGTLKEGTYKGIFTHGNFSDPISFEILKDTADWRVSFTSLAQNAFEIPMREVNVEGDSIYFTLQSDRYTYRFKNTWNDASDSLSGWLEVDTLKVPYSLSREAAPDTPSGNREEVRFEVNGLQFGGTLWHPSKSNGKALVFVTSSGGADRSGSRAEAMHFARKGYTTFHYDKRGTGVSEGDWQAATMEDLLSDDLQAIRYFVQKTGIPLSAIGIKGSSQGGAKIPYLLNALPELHYGISVSCPGTTLLESDLNAWKNSMAGKLGGDLEAAAKLQGKVFEYIAGTLKRSALQKAIAENKSRSWFTDVWIPEPEEVQTDPKLLYNPVPYFSNTKQPVLLIQGTLDEIIPPNSYQTISNALNLAGNTTYKVVLLENASHSMYDVGPSDFPYWSKLHNNYLSTMENWIGTITAITR